MNTRWLSSPVRGVSKPPPSVGGSAAEHALPQLVEAAPQHVDAFRGELRACSPHPQVGAHGRPERREQRLGLLKLDARLHVFGGLFGLHRAALRARIRSGFACGRSEFRPEIYTLGHRNTLGLIVYPVTGAIWQHENGPNGGDEINIIVAGRNYGWPVVSFGRDYAGPRVSEHPTQPGMESPLVSWIPSIAVAGMAVYTGRRFPAWTGNVFVGAMREGEIPGTGHLQRIVFNAKMEELRRESMLRELRQRIREVRQGPDDLLYLLTDEDPGALLSIEPAS